MSLVFSAEMEEQSHHEAMETSVPKRWWTTVQKDQRDNVSTCVVNMWSESRSAELDVLLIRLYR